MSKGKYACILALQFSFKALRSCEKKMYVKARVDVYEYLIKKKFDASTCTEMKHEDVLMYPILHLYMYLKPLHVP